LNKRIIQPLKVVIFLVILIALLFVVQWCFINHSDPSYQNINGFYDQKENTLDAVYIGSSNCFTYWNPAVAWDEYGVAIYSYSANNLLFESAEYIIKDCVKTQPNAKFIVNINTLVGDELEMKEVHNTASNMPLSFNRFQLVNHLCEIGDVSFSERMEYYFPIIRFHNNYSSVLPGNLLYKNDGFKGSSTYEPYVRIATDVSAVYGKSNEICELPEYLIESTDSLLDYCDKNGINVVFVTVPQARSEEKNKVFNALNKLIADRGYPVLNLMEKTDEIGIDRTCDFYNIQHTNIHGSIKFTHYITQYMIERYGFSDKRGDENFADWDGMTEGYFDAVSPYILDVERDVRKRDFTIASPQNLVLSNGTLTWDASENSEYYHVYKKEGKTKPWIRVAEKLTESFYFDEGFADASVYTVVPVVTKNGEEYYGNFPYLGIPMDENDVGNVETNKNLED